MTILSRYYLAMKHNDRSRIRDLIERLARINAADEWKDDINPTQRAALSYLANANRFSRAPSQVAEFMAATRGTVSQTLKALLRKELISEVRPETDRRWISYSVTSQGRTVLDRITAIDEAVAQLDDEQAASLQENLEALARQTLLARDRKAFGICAGCKYHEAKGAGAFCLLLNEPLKPEETSQICHEFREAA